MPIRDFDTIARLCLVLGGLGVLLGLPGLAGANLTGMLQQLEAAGLPLPGWFPYSVLDHLVLLCVIQVLLNGLMMVAGWGLLRHAPWSMPVLKLSAWLFLVGTLAFGLWWIESMGPATPADDPVEQALRSALIWMMGGMTVVMAAAIGWFLWRLRGAIGPGER